MARPRGSLGIWRTAAIGIGGMVGGGIFAVLGLAVQLAGGGTPVAFAIAGAVALLTAYSYAKLSVAYPSQGGTVTFLNHAFGTGLITGSLNVLLWLSYVVMLSLYSFALGSYATALIGFDGSPLWRHIFISVSVVALTGLNMLSVDAVSRAEIWIVGIKLSILIFFCAVGFSGIDTARLSPGTWEPAAHLIAGGMIIFMAYEGFELIANTADDVKNPKRTLTVAYYASVGFVIALYVMVALVAVGNLSPQKIVAARDYALAEAARPFLGHLGFMLIALAAVLSTASALNATLYGAGRLSYVIAKDGELPEALERKVWGEPLEGLLITAAITLLIANLFDLSSISMMGSAGFLLIFGAVNLACAVRSHDTGARRWLSIAGAVACAAALGALVWQSAETAPEKLWVLAGLLGISFLIEAGYRIVTRRQIRVFSTRGTNAEG